MKNLWDRFEAWLAENWPEGLACLNPPASDEQITSLEQALGVKLPEDYVTCLKIHNGQRTNSGGDLFDGGEFLSSDEVLGQWNIWKELLDDGDFDGAESEPAHGIGNDWWNARWIPFTHNGGGDHFCIDLAPAATGQAGQVISMWHDSAERTLLAPDFGAWLKTYVDAVCAGDYVYAEEYDAIVSREDAGLP
jgi:cell wall assembly regulator SMI1